MKKFKRLLVIITVYCFLLACNNSASKKETKTPDSSITEISVVDSVALRAAGVYSGFLPCADCAGIMTFLLLNPDMTYQIEETFQGKSDTAYRHAGNWKRDNDKIVLSDGDEVRMSYLLEGQQLLQLDNQGNRITGNLGDKYVLNKQTLAKNPAWKDKSDAGIDFIGLGNEPFWNLEIDKGFKIAFNTADMKSPVTTTYAEPVSSNGTKEFHIETTSTKLDITITSQFCSDGMSDFLYEYKVMVTYNGKKYSGCGAMLGSL